MTRDETSSTLAAARIRSDIFYGWVIVGCTFVILCMAYGLQFTFGVFMPSIAADTGWDRASLSVPYALYVFLYSALGAVTGRLTDRWGPRVVLTVGGCLLGCGIMLMSQVSALWQIYLFFGLVAASGMSAAFGPLVAGYLYDFTGSYVSAFVLSAVLNTGAFMLLFFLRKPENPSPHP